MSRAASVSAAPSRSSASVTCLLSAPARTVSRSRATAGSPPDSATSRGGGPARIDTVPSSATSNPPSRASATRVCTADWAAVIWSAPFRAATEAMTRWRAASSPAAAMPRALSRAASAAAPVQNSWLRRISRMTASTCAARLRAASSQPSASRRSESGRHASACDRVGRVTAGGTGHRSGGRRAQVRRPTCARRVPIPACWRRPR